MIFTVKTMDPHSEDCCGCWNIVLDEDAPLEPYARCNECGEIIVATFEWLGQRGEA